MKKSKIISLVILPFLVAGSFTGCSKKEKDKKEKEDVTIMGETNDPNRTTFGYPGGYWFYPWLFYRGTYIPHSNYYGSRHTTGKNFFSPSNSRTVRSTFTKTGGFGSFGKSPGA
jgi:hypothetical protein